MVVLLAGPATAAQWLSWPRGPSTQAPVPASAAVIGVRLRIAEHEGAREIWVDNEEVADSIRETETLRWNADPEFDEYLWRLLLDWPALLGEPADRARFLGWRKRLLAVQAGDGRDGADIELADDLHVLLADQPAVPACADLAGEAPAVLLPWGAAEDWAARAFSWLARASYSARARSTSSRLMAL